MQARGFHKFGNLNGLYNILTVIIFNTMNIILKSIIVIQIIIQF